MVALGSCLRHKSRQCAYVCVRLSACNVFIRAARHHSPAAMMTSAFTILQTTSRDVRIIFSNIKFKSNRNNKFSINYTLLHNPTHKAVNRGDKRTRRVRDRVFVKFERSRRYRCQEKKSRRGRARDPVFRDPPTPRTSPRSLFAARDSPPLPPPMV